MELGWDDDALYALLRLLRSHMLHYIYLTEEDFLDCVQSELSDKPREELKEAVKGIMKRLSMAMDTRAFRNEVIRVLDKDIFVHEYLYETIQRLAENRKGGTWHPDNLCRFMDKIKRYRDMLDKNAGIFFSRVQIWGTKVSEAKDKFYALREVYLDLAKSAETIPSEGIARVRFQLLHEVFEHVPPPTKATITAKCNLWSPDELVVLVDSLVQITSDIHKTGTSSLIPELARTLGRTEISCENKLMDVRNRFFSNKTTLRAANLPDILFHPESDACKIFSSNWSDPTDPWAQGFQAYKNHRNKQYALRKRQARKFVPVSHMRTRRREKPRSARNETLEMARLPLPRSSVESRPPSPAKSTVLKPTQHSAFVRECAKMIKRDEETTLLICLAMNGSLALYQNQRIQEFHAEVAKHFPDVTIIELLFDVKKILRRYRELHCSLDKFAMVVRDEEEQDGTSRGTAVLTSSTLEQWSKCADPSYVPGHLKNENDVVYKRFAATEEATKYSSKEILYRESQLRQTATPEFRVVGKSNSKTPSMIRQVAADEESVQTSPSIHHSSPENFYDNDFGADLGEDIDDDGDRSLDGSSDDERYSSVSRSSSRKRRRRMLAHKGRPSECSSRSTRCRNSCCRPRETTYDRFHRERQRGRSQRYRRHERHVYMRGALTDEESDESSDGDNYFADLVEPIESNIRELKARLQKMDEERKDRERQERKELWQTDIQAKVEAMLHGEDVHSP
ncbi:hypothetical protein Poli38472_000641 [Pythium oligandrum]|uniref:Uncharacterized protein n=1 Tax=Pythium oligandrum TaxID=41045 RepID=A0A8K1FH24_PYTOL|nr:hypothetical protein Poli38472_000641 [Pythium oligandrum]|eukprot:TMW60599.1 hypothetical protein Poli38472_000641 [Pythium oligandrum]